MDRLDEIIVDELDGWWIYGSICYPYLQQNHDFLRKTL